MERNLFFSTFREKLLSFRKNLPPIKKIDAHFIIGSIFALPFRVSSLHVVWNAGVLEHFKHREQQLAISEAYGTIEATLEVSNYRMEDKNVEEFVA